MTLTHSENDFGRWPVEGHPLTIEYSLAAMDGIRAAVIDGYYKIARGGVEVGGVLFGVRERNLVRVLTFRPLACEYASGPSFVLSEKDQEALRGLLESSASDPELDGLVPVGWYHSHTRSEIFLSEADLEIYDRYFPETWQVSLILRAERMKPVRAGFFFREAGRQVRAESSYLEFSIEPLGRKRAVPVNQAVSTQAAPDLSPSPVPRPFRRPCRLWVDWLLFAMALCLVLAGAAILAKPYLPPGLLQSWVPASLLAPDPSPTAIEAVEQQNRELAREIERLRAELEKQAERSRQMEAALEQLQERLQPRQGSQRRRPAASSTR